MNKQVKYLRTFTWQTNIQFKKEAFINFSSSSSLLSFFPFVLHLRCFLRASTNSVCYFTHIHNFGRIVSGSHFTSNFHKEVPYCGWSRDLIKNEWIFMGRVQPWEECVWSELWFYFCHSRLLRASSEIFDLRGLLPPFTVI